MKYVQTESRVQPKETEQISGSRYLVRQNIKQESRTDDNGAAFILWIYDEAVMSEAEFAAYQAVNSFEATREADIIDDYTMQLIEEGTL